MKSTYEEASSKLGYMELTINSSRNPNVPAPAVDSMKFWNHQYGKKSTISMPLTFMRPPYLLVMKDHQSAFAIPISVLFSNLKAIGSVRWHERVRIAEEMKSVVVRKDGKGDWTLSKKDDIFWVKNFKFTQAQSKTLEEPGIMCTKCGIFLWPCFERYDPCLCKEK